MVVLCESLDCDCAETRPGFAYPGPRWEPKRSVFFSMILLVCETELDGVLWRFRVWWRGAFYRELSSSRPHFLLQLCAGGHKTSCWRTMGVYCQGEVGRQNYLGFGGAILGVDM